ncbi:MAG: type IV pilus assembly protein PilM [Akkermansia sp.]|nr:type IV pilus assembly protein PilM [Akkermansia sp.]
MAEYKTTVALEIGAQSVTMGVFTPSGKGYALSRYARKEIVLDPVEEGMRMDYVSSAIAELVTELKVKRGSDVRNVVSGQQVFMRFIKLMALDDSDIEEQVGYEAQQHIPFPLDEIQWDYQELPDSGTGEKEVLLVAIKKDVLDGLNSQVEESGLKTRSVDCSITSLYNAFRVSYPEEEQPVMILDIGAKTTDIIFAEAGRFFTRSVTAAGSFVTNSIAREFGMSFREAEKLKVESGMVSLGNGFTDNLPEQDAALATTIRNAMNRLSSEVQRTINHYRAQYKGSAPVKAYICGGGARMPYSVEFLQSALNIEVEYLNPLAAFSIGNKVDEEALGMDALCLGPVAGAAVSGAGVGEFSIDLVPTSVGKERAELQMLPKVIAGGAVAVVGAAAFALMADSAASDAESMLAKARPALEEIESVNSSIQSAKTRYDRAAKELDTIMGHYTMRTAYADILKQLSERGASVKFWFSEFAPLINYEVEKTSLADSPEVKGTRLIDPNKSRSAGNNSAINQAPEAVDVRARNKAPKVTAICVSGYTTKKPGDDRSQEQRQAIYDLVAKNFDERSADSLFSYQNADIMKNLNHYYQFIDSKGARGKVSVPDYVEKFTMIMPLKTPIAIPELGEGK